jgi:hypothetical protein
LAAMAAGLSLLAADASAAVIQLTATGTVSSGYDQTGMFGPAGSDLAGAIFSLVSTYDTSLGLVVIQPNSQAVVAGPGFTGAPPYMGSAVLTVNGVSVNVTSTQSGFLAENVTGVSSFYGDDAVVDNIETFGGVRAGISFATPHVLDLYSGVHGVCGGGDTCTGGFGFGQGSFVQPYTQFYDNHGLFTVSTFDIVVSGAVPEPATWAMMILGFGMAGASLRGRRRSVAVG